MANQIQRYTGHSEAPAWAWADSYRAARQVRQRGDRQNTASQNTIRQGPTNQSTAAQSTAAQSTAPARQVTARAQTFDAQIRETGDLQVTTDDGDKVSISFAALSRLHAESFQGQTDGAAIDYGSATSSKRVSVGIQVNGTLDEKEVADISKLLGQLSASVHDSGPGVAAPQLQDGGSLASLSSFQFAYHEKIRASYSQSQVAPPTIPTSQDPAQTPAPVA